LRRVLGRIIKGELIGFSRLGMGRYVPGSPHNMGILLKGQCLGEEVRTCTGSETAVQVSCRDEKSAHVSNELGCHGVKLLVPESILK
jgi:hypothetical protein